MKLKKQYNYIYLLGIIFLFTASIFSTGYHHFDEHFQILEFAGLKLGLTSASNLPWEYRYQMRSSLQPVSVVVLYRIFGIVGADNPFFLTCVLRLLSGGLTFLAAVFMCKVFKNRIGNDVLKMWFLILSFTSWFIIYIGVRFSSENWSGLLFAIGFSYYFLDQKRNYLSSFTLGILLGLSFLFRYQAAFLILGFSLWLLLIKKEVFTRIIGMGVGIFIIAMIGILMDRWFYGEWTITSWNYFWNYFTQNIIEDKVSGFGTEPWWWYFTKSIESGAPISILFVPAFIVVAIFKPKSPVIWSIVPFFLIHSVIGHKELRFLFPISFFLPIIIISGMDVVQKKYMQNLSSNKYMRSFMKLIFIVNAGVLLVVMLKPADSQISLYHTLYKNYKKPTTLYCVEGNPYHRVLDINFYKRKNLSVQPIASIDDIPEGKSKLVVLKHRDESNNLKLGKLIYTTYPDWVLKFNFNNWLDRSNCWYIYEIN